MEDCPPSPSWAISSPFSDCRTKGVPGWSLFECPLLLSAKLFSAFPLLAFDK